LVADILFWFSVLAVVAFLMYWLVRTHDHELPKDFKLKTQQEQMSDAAGKWGWLEVLSYLIPPFK